MGMGKGNPRVRKQSTGHLRDGGGPESARTSSLGLVLGFQGPPPLLKHPMVHLTTWVFI